MSTQTPVERNDEERVRAAAAQPRRRPRIIRWVISVAGVALLVPFLFMLGNRLGKDPTFVRSPLLGKPAPAFDLPRIDAPGRLSSADLSGRVYVVNFWASWCVPCREENRVLDSFYRRWRPRGVELVGILYNDTVGAARQFREQLGGSWPLVDDPAGRAAIDHGVFGVPETFVVDERGIVMAKFIGAVGPTTLDEALASLDTGGAPVSGRSDRYQTGR